MSKKYIFEMTDDEIQKHICDNTESCNGCKYYIQNGICVQDLNRYKLIGILFDITEVDE